MEHIKKQDKIGNRYFVSHFVPIKLHGYDKKHCLVITHDLTEIIRLNKLLNTDNVSKHRT